MNDQTNKPELKPLEELIALAKQNFMAFYMNALDKERDKFLEQGIGFVSSMSDLTLDEKKEYGFSLFKEYMAGAFKAGVDAFELFSIQQINEYKIKVDQLQNKVAELEAVNKHQKSKIEELTTMLQETDKTVIELHNRVSDEEQHF